MYRFIALLKSLSKSPPLLPGTLLSLELNTEVTVRVGDLVLAVVPDEASLVGPAGPTGQTAQETQEYSLELVAENAINDEVY